MLIKVLELVEVDDFVHYLALLMGLLELGNLKSYLPLLTLDELMFRVTDDQE